MTVPTNQKTWPTTYLNQAVAAQGSADATSKLLIRTLKNSLIGFASNPWTVRGSSNSVAAGMDQVDRWSANSNLVWNSEGSAHSWIVLRQTGIATNFELCINCTSTAPGFGCFISPSAGFTVGSTTARPTATDSITLQADNTVWAGADAAHVLSVFVSSDGQCTRVFCFRAGSNNGFIILDKADNPVSGWGNPCVAYCVGTQTGECVTAANLGSLSAGAQGRGAAGGIRLAMTAEATLGSPSSLPALAGVGDAANDYDSNWPFFPIGLVSTTVSNKGRHGSLFDAWVKPSGVSNGDTFPNDVNDRRFFAVGQFLHPWTANATAPVIT